MRAAALVLAGLLAGCSTPMPIVLAPQGPPPGVDGRYRGTARLVRAANAGCPRSGARVLEIQGGSVTLSYRVTARQLVPLTAEFQPDGKLQASDGVGRLDGQLTGNRLEITVASQMCENHWTLTRVN